jgi:hypothetical protein
LKWLDFISSSVVSFVISRMYMDDWNPVETKKVTALKYSESSWVNKYGWATKLDIRNASSYAYISLYNMLRKKVVNRFSSKTILIKHIAESKSLQVESWSGISGRLTKYWPDLRYGLGPGEELPKKVEFKKKRKAYKRSRKFVPPKVWGKPKVVKHLCPPLPVIE